VRYDHVWYRYCFERFSWYADMILIYTYIYMYYILPKIYVNMHRFFNTSEYLPSAYIYICAQKIKQFAQSITFEYIICVYSIVECIFLLNYMQRLYYVPYTKIVKVHAIYSEKEKLKISQTNSSVTWLDYALLTFHCKQHLQL